MIFIQENAAFIQVLIYQNCHNQLLNMIKFILLLNFKESLIISIKGKKWPTSLSKVANTFRRLAVLIESTESFLPKMVYKVIRGWTLGQSLPMLNFF